jgi:hypothetical protein
VKRRSQRVELPDRDGANRQSEDERRQHQLEGMGRTAEDQRQHADPVDFIGERRDRGAEGHPEEQALEAR